MTERFLPPIPAVENARLILSIRGGLPKSRRASLEPEEAQRIGVRSGVVMGGMLASGETIGIGDAKYFRRYLKRFRMMAYRALESGKCPKTSKAIQCYLLHGGDPMLEYLDARFEGVK